MANVSTSTELRQRLRALLAADSPVVAPGVYDAFSAVLVEKTGFTVACTTGAGIAAALLGRPDIGLASMTEVLDATARICAAANLSIIADCDTGYGNALNVQRTVSLFERAGVSALFIEDQTSPKRCGHFDDKSVIGTEEMVAKVRAAVDARTDPELVIMARTDALAVEGIDAALSRAEAYANAGAEMLFVEAPGSERELDVIADRLLPLGLPLVANIVEGGKTPMVSVTPFVDRGFKVVCMSGSLQKAAGWAMKQLLMSVDESGSVESFFPGRMLSLDERSEVLGLPQLLETAARYAAPEGG